MSALIIPIMERGYFPSPLAVISSPAWSLVSHASSAPGLFFRGPGSCCWPCDQLFCLQVGGRGWLQLWWEGIIALKSLSGLPRCSQGEARLPWTLCRQHPSWDRSFQGTQEDEGNGNAQVTVLRMDASRLHLSIHLLLSPSWFQKQCWGVCYSDPDQQFSCHVAWVWMLDLPPLRCVSFLIRQIEL